MRPRTIALLLAALSLLFPAVALAAPADPVTHGVHLVERQSEDALGYARHAQAVAEFERRWTHRALGLQEALGGDVGMVDAPWFGTHNSFNSVAEMGPALSATDSNQRLTLVDQLRMGVRSLELDVHLWLGRPVVCHADGSHAGCSTERTLGEVLAPVAAWLREHPSATILLYLEDHLDTEAGYAAGAEAVRSTLGDLVYAPSGPGCTELPAELTRDGIRAAGAQVVIVSDCGVGAAWPSVAHSWDTHGEARPVGFDPVGCGPDFTREDYDTRLIRYFEDSTWLTATASEAGAASRDDGLTPATVQAMLRCGVDLLGFDQLVPDGDVDALVWSWAPGQPGAGDCALTTGSGGRWYSEPCATPRPAACRTPSGSWVVSETTTTEAAPEACASAGGVFAAPRTAREQQELRAAGGLRDVRLGLRPVGDAWRGLDPR